jgi:hypothetical protein
MKNKKLTYFLGFLVLIVWGVIIYRIFNSAGNGNDETFIQPTKKTSKEPYNDYTIPKDTTHLLLKYRDPFAFKKQTDTPKLTIKKLIAVKVIPPPIKASNWNFIKYSGYIHNPGSKNLVAVVNINGKTTMMIEGEIAGQVKLIKNLQDSIEVAFDGKTTYIKMQTGAL